MHSHLTITVAAITLAGSISVYTARDSQPTTPAPQAAEVKARLNALPPAVKATVEAETRNATLKGVSEEKETARPSMSWNR